MAEIWPTEGLDLVIAIFPKNGSNVATTYMGLWGTPSFSASTVGTAANARASYTEATGGSYARQSIAAASWGANADGGGGASEPGRKTTAAQVVFPTATAPWGLINGFYIVNTSTAGAGSLYWACNFDDTTAITVNTNDIVKVTPTAEIRN